MKVSVAAANAGIAAMAALIDAGSPPGKLKFFTGSAPSDPSLADSGTLLSSGCTFSNTSFGAPSSGTATANAIASDTNCAASGTAGYWRAYNNAGTCVAQGTVGTSGADINLNTLSIIAGGTLTLSSLTWTQPQT